MKRSRLRRYYRNLPALAQRVLTSEHLRYDVSVLRSACRLRPDVYALHSALSEALLRANRRREAHRVWLNTVKSFPRTPNPFFQRANWALEHGAFSEAAKRLRQCLALDHGYFRETARFWRAEALYRLGRFDAAIVELSQVRDDFEEPWFLNYRSRSKSDILNDISTARSQ